MLLVRRAPPASRVLLALWAPPERRARLESRVLSALRARKVHDDLWTKVGTQTTMHLAAASPKSFYSPTTFIPFSQYTFPQARPELKVRTTSTSREERHGRGGQQKESRPPTLSLTHTHTLAPIPSPLPGPPGPPGTVNGTDPGPPGPPGKLNETTF